MNRLNDKKTWKVFQKIIYEGIKIYKYWVIYRISFEEDFKFY
ncbi:hypothetical protein CJ739_1562 [Mariniflexile rhizosphaerae]|nr:hypothetical protein CJ739_1562 [Mariniflexile sp. TRM1-10]PLB17796.1 MAG: hypothetical protein TRG1_3379 [Flavobacteriaceae bacterium FS1-H7996/R]